MRFLGRLSGIGAFLFALALAGCGGAPLEEGIPKEVDMNKSYTPQVDMPGMTPKAAVQARKKAATPAPAATQ